jgi:hypothetical protein
MQKRWVLLTIPIIGIVLLLTWVAGVALIQGPGSMTNLIVALVVISTAILAAIEASKLGMQADPKEGNYSPTQWAFSILLMWFISYPWYLFKRRRFGRANLLVPGIIVSVLFVGVVTVMIVSINQMNQEVQQRLQKFQDSALELQKQFSNHSQAAQLTEPSSPRQSLAPVFKPSFDCTLAHSVSEKLICLDPELSALDNEYSLLYRKAANATPNRNAFAQLNRQEWRKRDRCTDKDCVTAWYADRNDALQHSLDTQSISTTEDAGIPAN